MTDYDSVLGRMGTGISYILLKKIGRMLGYSPKNTYLCSVKRRNQVEPRCAERWHLRDDEQFDLATWFLSLK